MAILTNPTGVATGQTTADGTVTTDTSGGIIYTVVTQSVIPPIASQIKLGQNELGLTPDWAGQAFASFGFLTVSFSAMGLTASTTYYFHFVHYPGHGAVSNVVSSQSFTMQPPDVTGSGRDRSRNSIVCEML